MSEQGAASIVTSMAHTDTDWDRFRTHHAFIVGINVYTNGISPLRTAANDARRLAEVLADTARKDHFRVHPPLIDASATGAQVRAMLHTTMKAIVGPDDRVLVYFAGHGIAADSDDGPAGYLVPSDATPGNLSSFIAMTDMQAALDALPCRHLLVILDCCFSGAFRWSSQHRAIGSVPKRIYRERFDRFVRDGARQVITSAAYDQKALDVLAGRATGDRGLVHAPDGADHSPFALALFDALDGQADAKLSDQQDGDGVITATELYSYIRDRVEPATISASERLRQTPSFFPLKNHDKGEFLFLHPRHRLNLPEMDAGDSPYKGLESFNEGDSHLFYGREAVVTKLRHRADDADGKLIVVTGASGTGKSSVIKAGLLPQLRAAKFNILPVMRPGEHPLAALEAALKGAVAPAVLVVDQLEEVISRCADPAERRRFDERLAALLDAGDPVVRIVLTVRSDFEPQVNHGALGPRWAKARFTVPPFSAAELREVVVMPAVQASMVFDPPKLVDQIIEEVVQSPGALPLLSYALNELFLAHQKRGGTDRALTQADYDGLGGVRGALTTRADALHDGLDATRRDVLRRVMLRMVSLEGDLAGKRVATGDTVVSAADAPFVDEVVGKLVESRLVVRGEGHDAVGDFIEPAHDALVRAWPKLREWIDEAGRDTLILASRLAAAAEEYAHAGKDGLLWNNHPNLPAVEKALKQGRAGFNLREQAFISRSVALKKRRWRIGVGVTAAVVIALAGATTVAWIERNEAVRAAAVARAGELATTAESLFASFPERRVLLALEANRIAAVPKATGLIRSARADFPYRMVLRGHAGGVSDALLSPDGRTVLTTGSDHTARLWSVADGRDLHVLRGHKEIIFSAQFSADGKTVLTASWDGTARLWDVATGKALRVLRGHDGQVNSAELSTDGKTVLTASRDMTARLWDAATGQELRALRGHHGSVVQARFSPDGKTVVTASEDTTARLWNAASGKELRVLRGHEHDVSDARFSVDGKTVLTASADGTARLWNASSGKQLRALRGHGDTVISAQLSADGTTVLTANGDGTARLWDAASGEELQVLRGHEGPVIGAQFSVDGGTVLTASDDHSARLWDVDSGAELRALRGHASKVVSARFSADGTTVLTASDDGTARLWDAGVAQAQRSLRGHEGTVLDTQLSSDGAIVLSAGADATARLWDLASGQERRVLRGHAGSVLQARLSADGKTVLTVGDDRTVRLWDAAGGQELRALRGHAGRVESVGFSPDGRTVWTTSADQTARLWDAASGEALNVLRGHQNTVYVARVSNDGKTVVTASGDDTARLWDAASGKELQVLRAHEGPVLDARFSVDGTMLVTAGFDNTAWLWTVATGAKLRALRGHAGIVEGAQFSADGRTVMTSSWDGTVRLWDVASAQEVRALRGHGAKVTGAQFSADGRTVLTASEDGTVRLWDADSGQALRVLRGHAGRVTSARLSVDARTIVTAGDDGTVRLWTCDECRPFDEVARDVATWIGRELTPDERRQYGLPDRSPAARP